MTVFEFIDYFASSYCRVTVLLKTKNGIVKTQMTPELAAFVLDPNGVHVCIHTLYLYARYVIEPFTK